MKASGFALVDGELVAELYPQHSGRLPVHVTNRATGETFAVDEVIVSAGAVELFADLGTTIDDEPVRDTRAADLLAMYLSKDITAVELRRQAKELLHGDV